MRKFLSTKERLLLVLITHNKINSSSNNNENFDFIKLSRAQKNINKKFIMRRKKRKRIKKTILLPLE